VKFYSGSCVVILSVYDPDNGGTPLPRVVGTPFMASMNYLTTTGIFMLYPELTLLFLTATCKNAFYDVQESIEDSFLNIEAKGIAPLRIGNLLLTTSHLMKYAAQGVPTKNMILHINWKPRHSFV
jgi:hypothetical protein